MGVPGYPYKDPFKSRCIGTELEFAFLPRKCRLTNKFIWLEYAYKQTAMWTGPEDHLFEYRWYNKDEFLIARLKGEV